MKGLTIKIVKSVILVVATAIMGACVYFIPESAGPVSITYTSVLGLYLGLDIAAMISKSASLGKGEFETLNTYKYAVSGVCLIALIVLCAILKDKVDVTTPMTSFIASAMIVIGCVMTGLEGNKIAANNDGQKEAENE